MRTVVAAALAVAAWQPETAPVAPPDPLVRIDAFVVDARERPLETLKAADFELREDGALQTIEAVRFVRTDRLAAPVDPLPPIASAADERREAARPGVRLYGLYLDEYHVSRGAADRVRDRLLQFVDEDLRPRDLLVVMKPVDSLLAIRLAQNRDTARHAIASFVGRKGDYAPKDAYERDVMPATPSAVDAMRAQVTVSALNALAEHLGSASADSRKTWPACRRGSMLSS